MNSNLPEIKKTPWQGLALLVVAFSVSAQAPVEDATSRDQAIQRSQHATGAAYRALQQTQYESKLAEQEFLNAQEAHHAAQQHAEERKRQLETAKQAFDAAKAKEAQARQRYDQALISVDKAFEKPPVTKK